jgi:sphinganine-1-phosphate aldolase
MMAERLLGRILILTDGKEKSLAEMAREACDQINSELEHMKPVEILCLTILAIIITKYVTSFLSFVYYNLTISSIKIALFRFATTYIPQAREKLEHEKDKMLSGAIKKFQDSRKSSSIRYLPNKGQNPDEILKRIQGNAAISSKKYKDGGNVTGAVYTKDEEHWNFISDVMRASIVSNPLHIDEFLYVTQMEAELIRWTLDLYNGGPDSCGIVTSGGTESIILAMLAYREKAKAEKGITQPNMVMSETAHCAFDKGGFYFGIEIRKVPLTKDFRCDVQAMVNAMDSNTICLVASAPEYAFGNYDPVAEIAEIA